MLTVVHDVDESNNNAGWGRSLLDEIVRDSARQMLAAALEAEVAAYIAQFIDQVDENWASPGGAQRLPRGADRAYRHGCRAGQGPAGQR